jgi:hypothetical protein
MGCGFNACKADVVEKSFVKEICPEEFGILDPCIHKHIDGKWDEFAKQMSFGIENVDFELVIDPKSIEPGEDPKSSYETAYKTVCEEITKNWNMLAETFKGRTGLDLYLSYHDMENDGSHYDEIDGVFWSVGGVWQRTEAGERYNDKIQEKSWVQYG